MEAKHWDYRKFYLEKAQTPVMNIDDWWFWNIDWFAIKKSR